MRPKFATFSRYRPRILTLVVLFLIAAPITLANFTSEIVPVDSAIRGWEAPGAHKGQYGWPVIWHWHHLFLGPGPCGIIIWDYSPAWLAGNVVLWLLLLAMPAGACEWLLRRNRPGLRFSLRTMLVAVAAAAVGCAWFAAARNRANLQDPLIAEFEEYHGMDTIMIERPGPKWLEFIVPDHFRRNIIGIEIGDSSVLDDALARRLEKLPRLQYLSANVERWSPGMIDVMAGMRRLRWLCINRSTDYEPKRAPRKRATLFDALMQWRGGKSESPEREGPATEDSEIERSSSERRRASRDFFHGIGKLTQIESLRLIDWGGLPREELAGLAGLKNLKLLIVSFGPDAQGSLSHLPALPKLDTIRIEHKVSGQDLRHLAVFPRLKSVDLTDAEFDGAELADLAPLKSLEELSIDAESLSKQSLDSLCALKRLKSLSIDKGFSFDEPDRMVSLALDESDQLRVPAPEADVFRRALKTLRQSNPGIVIKRTPSDVYTFDISPPFEYEEPVLYSTWLPGDHRLLSPSAMHQLSLRLRAAAARRAGQSTADESEAEGEE